MESRKCGLTQMNCPEKTVFNDTKKSKANSCVAITYIEKPIRLEQKGRSLL